MFLKKISKIIFVTLSVITVSLLLTVNSFAKTMNLEAEIIGAETEYFNGELFVVYTSDALSVAEVLSQLPESAQRAVPELGLIDFSTEISDGKIISVNDEKLNSDGSDSWHIAINGRLSTTDIDKQYLKAEDRITVWRGKSPAVIALIDARSASSGIISVTDAASIDASPIPEVTLRWYDGDGTDDAFTEIITDENGFANIPEDKITAGLHRIEIIPKYEDGIPCFYCDNPAISVNIRKTIEPLHMWIGVVAGSVIIAAAMIYFVKIKK